MSWTAASRDSSNECATAWKRVDKQEPRAARASHPRLAPGARRRYKPQPRASWAGHPRPVPGARRRDKPQPRASWAGHPRPVPGARRRYKPQPRASWAGHPRPVPGARRRYKPQPRASRPGHPRPDPGARRRYNKGTSMIKAGEISESIRRQLAGYEAEVDLQEVGRVIEVGDGIARIYGLDRAMAGELLAFPGDVVGMVLNLEQDNVGAVLLGDDTLIKEGDVVKRTNRIAQVPVGEALVGRVVNALGEPVDGKGPINAKEFRPIERYAPGVVDRRSVKEPLQTGLKAIDAMIPIGRGQRELIIGDRGTGKTAIGVDTIINQQGQDVFCFYVAI